MRFVLEENPGITVVGEAADGQAGVDAVARDKPDVVLLDLSMPVLDGLEAIPLMLDVSPGTQIIGLSGFTADRMAETMIAQGAGGLLREGRRPRGHRADGPSIRDARIRAVLMADQVSGELDDERRVVGGLGALAVVALYPSAHEPRRE